MFEELGCDRKRDTIDSASTLMEAAEEDRQLRSEIGSLTFNLHLGGDGGHTQ